MEEKHQRASASRETPNERTYSKKSFRAELNNWGRVKIPPLTLFKALNRRAQIRLNALIAVLTECLFLAHCVEKVDSAKWACVEQ